MVANNRKLLWLTGDKRNFTGRICASYQNKEEANDQYVKDKTFSQVSVVETERCPCKSLNVFGSLHSRVQFERERNCPSKGHMLS